MKKKGEIYTNRHSCFLLQYHLVLVTKYRKQVMTGAVRERMIKIVREFFKNRELNILEMEVCADHIHVLFEFSPNIALSVLVNTLKTWTSRKIRKEFRNEIRKYYWKPYFWSMSYFICTVNEKSVEMVKNYIASQDIKN